MSAAASSEAAAPAVATPAAAKRPRSLPVEFLLGAVATSCACVFSNPFEVVKTRMQLQGELIAVGGARPYRNAIHAFYVISTTEGVRGIQRGLIPGIAYQSMMNGVRLGMYGPLKKMLGSTEQGTATSFAKNMLAAALSGSAGALVGSPFFLIKARLQAQGSAATSGAKQYHYRGLADGLRQVYTSDGFLGLFRGVTAAVPRVAVGSATQLSSYDHIKHLVLATPFFEDNVYAHFAASLITGLVVTTAMNPFDVVSTRLYSQKVVDGKGTLYNGFLDCFVKTARVEGVKGFYKGWLAHYLRLGPHTIFTFIFWEQAQKAATKLGI